VGTDVWGIVCLAALSAMDHGRRQLWRLASSVRGEATSGPRQATLYELWGLPTPQVPAVRPLSERAGALAVADFWARIADFVATEEPPPEWEDTVEMITPSSAMVGPVLTWEFPTLHI
jgi:hypothetical protein